MQSDVNKRRKERQRKIRRRRLKVAFIFFLIISLITLTVMCFTVFFPIKRISVSGSKIYSNSQIIKASKLTTDDNLLTVSDDEIQDNIRKSLPYVDSVKLKRVLPDAVILTITDAKEYAYFAAGGKYYILSENGYILKEQTETPENVFEIVSSGITGDIGEKAVYTNSAEQEVVNTLINELGKKEINIDKINVSNILQISLEVEGRFSVVLGTTEYVEQKIAHLSSMIESIPDRKGKINLSMWTPTNSQGSFVEKES